MSDAPQTPAAAPAAPASPVSTSPQGAVNAAHAQAGGIPQSAPTLKQAGESARQKFEQAAAAEGQQSATPAPAATPEQAASGDPATTQQAPKVTLNGKELSPSEVQELQDSMYRAQILNGVLSGDPQAIEALKKAAPEVFGLKTPEEAEKKQIPNPTHDPVIEANNKRLTALENEIEQMRLEKTRIETFKQLDTLKARHRMGEFLDEEAISRVEQLAFLDRNKEGSLDAAYAKHANVFLNIAKKAVSGYAQSKVAHSNVNAETGGGAPVSAPTGPAKTLKEARDRAKARLSGPMSF